MAAQPLAKGPAGAGAYPECLPGRKSAQPPLGGLHEPQCLSTITSRFDKDFLKTGKTTVWVKNKLALMSQIGRVRV
jgi:hypothetical protein